MYVFAIQINNLQGDLADHSATKASLIVSNDFAFKIEINIFGTLQSY